VSQQYLSVSEAGRQTGTSPSAVTRWILNGAALKNGSRLKLKAIRLPGGFRTTQQWVDEFIEALTSDRTGSSVASEVVGSRAEQATQRLVAAGW
jgi:hypothetical protein